MQTLSAFTHRPALIAIALQLVLLVAVPSAYAHCDTLDGPVIKAARQALDTGDVNSALIWVQSGDEAEIKAAFQKARSIRKLSPAAKEVADTYFFETLVRVHRQGEGAPYTGLKPAGEKVSPAITAADNALKTGKLEPVAELLTSAVHNGLHEQFNSAFASQKFDSSDVIAGRKYVTAYVEFIHYVERIYEAASIAAHGHYPEQEIQMHKD